MMMNEPLPEPKHYNSRISQRVNDAILQGMEIEPEKRTATVFKFRESLGLVVQPRRTPPPNPLPASEEGGLKSCCGMDYTKLRDLLKAGKWKKADEETKRVMLAVAKREKERWLDVKLIDNFPCADLHTIDRLWVKYSDGKFGFSVQKRIYQSFDGTREYNSDIWVNFAETIGWKRKGGDWLFHEHITFDITAPDGHLPNDLLRLGGRFRMINKEMWRYLFSRVETCRL
ncbi:GUN4 domain-containing protein [Anabaena lutea]|uniref:GUN4 domain-containing protein n=1 Tax=Anabaena lutea TaxID=212350 RepID=UPI003BB7B007